MNAKNHHWILYLITTTIILTIFVQLYWNYNNYLENKQQVRNEIQNSLDIAIDEYYTDISKSNFFAVINYRGDSKKNGFFKKFWNRRIDSSKKEFSISSIEIKTDDPKEYKKIPKLLDSILIESPINTIFNPNKITRREFIKTRPGIRKLKNKIDSIKFLKGIQSVAVALENDGINFTKLDSIFINQLSKKGIETPHYFNLIDKEKKMGTSNHIDKTELTLFLTSKSTFLRPDQSLRVYYQDPTTLALKKSSIEILLSLILSLTIIYSLFYLFQIIKKQKQLSEIKNDLINNITHEFKTPIATISTAIEAIESFNVIDDKEKTKKYASISAFQLKKLHQMVEKLLETATLDSENLVLQKESTNLVELIFKIIKKHELLTKKNISFTTPIDSIILEIDLFHFENAISNLIDNAIKYGGDNIEINLHSVLNTLEISVTDNGYGIEKNQQERVFDKFYRVPKGNTHDVKGFGIGLYYTKKIIEKHGGQIKVISNFENTTFKLVLPNE